MQAGTLYRRERFLVLFASALLIALCWAWLAWLASDMQSMAPAASNDEAMQQMAGMHAWSEKDFLAMLAMWVVMMTGMMLPTALPMILLYQRVAQKAATDGHAGLAPVWLFSAGYLLAWSAFSVAATLLQWWLQKIALLSPMMALSSPDIGAALLIAAGIYQWTPLKNTCLQHCREPARFLSQHWRPGHAGALRMGALHGGYCLGCCWVLMLLLFLGGVMNLLWIAAITLFVLGEKLMRFGRSAGRISGTGMILTGGAWLLF